VQRENNQIWRQFQHDLLSPLTVISGSTQLLQRQILRADGLSDLDRDQLLGNVIAVLGAAETLEARIGALVRTSAAPPGAANAPEPGAAAGIE
jgi:signal transduction histidine kinase